MRKHSLRTPSPATALALIALVVAVSGPGYAATRVVGQSATTKKPQRHSDAVQDRTLFNTLLRKALPHARVAFATSARTATTATHASSADNASTATSATTATNAAHASSADSASTAASATTASSTDAVASIAYVSANCNVPNGTTGYCRVRCPTGTYPTGGGGFNSVQSSVAITYSEPVSVENQSFPQPGHPATGWVVASSNTSGSTDTETVWAICMAARSLSPS